MCPPASAFFPLQSAQINDYLDVAALSLPLEQNVRQLGAFSRVNVGFANAPLGGSSSVLLLAERVCDSFSRLDNFFLAPLAQPGPLEVSFESDCFPTSNDGRPS